MHGARALESAEWAGFPAGRHRIELIVNGQTMAEAAFDLLPG